MKRALVLGGGACLWRDLQALSEHVLGGERWSWVVLAVNDAGWAYRFSIDHWVSLHCKKFPVWEAMRAQLGYSMDYTKWGGSWRSGPDDSTIHGIEHIRPVTRVGSSGLHAVEIALDELGADRVVTVGIPMDGSGHFWDPVPWDHAIAHHDAWRESVADFAGRVRALSGWTETLLGRPDRAWLDL